MPAVDREAGVVTITHDFPDQAIPLTGPYEPIFRLDHDFPSELILIFVLDAEVNGPPHKK
jgi:hypothetical protein